MEEELKEKFAVVECKGHNNDGDCTPKKIYIERILKPYLLKNGWEVVYFAHIKKVATLVGIRGTENAKELDKTILSFYQFYGEKVNDYQTKWDEFGQTGELKYAGLYLSGGIEIIALLDSTKQNGNIFANFITQKQLEGLVPKIDKVKEEFRDFGRKFQNF